MTDAFKPGDKVQWHSPQGAVQGTIKKKLTAPVAIKGHHVGSLARSSGVSGRERQDGRRSGAQGDRTSEDRAAALRQTPFFLKGKRGWHANIGPGRVFC